MSKRISLIDILGFEWNKGNLDHIKIHNVEYSECEEVFYNDPVYFEDPKHSTQELRFVVYGITNEERLLTVVFTIRNNKVRVISARDQHKKERIVYKQNKSK
ncbi:MAG TPA: BrnT family toxin [Candidatus Saccharimonadales bacterium]|nr:BrnT family toxin [Candidatus Saccharimonadales bacterium]